MLKKGQDNINSSCKDSVCVLDLTLLVGGNGTTGLFAEQQRNISALSTGAAQACSGRAGGWAGTGGSRDFIFSLLRVLMVEDQKIPIEQYIPHFKKNWCLFFFFCKILYVCHHFFFHMIHRKLKDPEGTKLCYTIYKIPRSPQLPNTLTTAQEPMRVQCTKPVNTAQ